MKFIRFILFPFAMVYGLVIIVRNKIFNFKAIKPVQFDFPVISIGNLSTGGTGKTPMTEYLIRQLASSGFAISVISRGYRRKTKGFILADEKTTYHEIGDEPMQFYHKFPDINVAVDEDRVNGVITVLKKIPETQVVLLDDAFQHRYLIPGIAILITDYNKPYYEDFILPVGNLREWRSGAIRANFIVVNKCPLDLSEEMRKTILQKINPMPTQKVFFSYIEYGEVKELFSENSISLKNMDVVLVTGIANPASLVTHLKEKGNKVISVAYPDHFSFNEKEILRIRKIFDNIASCNKMVVTTEKDAMRLKCLGQKVMNDLPVCYQTIKLDFIGESIIKEIVYYVRENQIDSNVFEEKDRR